MNAMLYINGNEHEFADWATSSTNWAWKKVLPYLEKSKSGPMQVESFTKGDSQLSELMMEAGKEKGYKVVDDGYSLGYGFAKGTVQNGARFSAAKAYLQPTKANLDIIKNALVTKITLDKTGRANGVEFVYNGTTAIAATSTKEVILTAGPISNPQILMLSGVGPQKTLSKLNIPVVKNIPVGKQMQDIIYVPLYFQFHSSQAQEVSKNELLENIFAYALNRDGPLSNHGISNLVAHWNTLGKSGQPDIQLTYKSFPKNAFDLQFYLMVSGYTEIIGRQILDNNRNGEIVVVNMALLKPKSAGSLKLASEDPSAKPKIYTHYLEHSDDVDTLLRALKQQASFVDTNTFKEHEAKLIRLPLVDCKDMEYQSDEYWRCYLAYMSRSSGRQFGSTRMGSDERDSVVDGHLKVHGIPSLRVVGSSAMPSSVGGQSNAATLMMAERAADFVKADWSNGKEQRVEL